MMKFSIKKIIFIIPLLVLVSGVIFWRPILTWGLEKYLKHFSQQLLDSDLHAEKMYIEDGRLVVVNPQLMGRTSVKEGGLALEADSLTIRLNTALWEGYVDLDIELHKPVVNLRQSSSEIRSRLLDSLALSSFIKVNTTLKIQEGILTFQDFTTEPPTPQTFYFQFNAECHDSVKGCLVASIDDPHLKNNCIALTLTQAEELALNVAFTNVHCPLLAHAITSFIPSIGNLRVSSGIIEGEMAITIPKEERTYAVGTLNLKDLAYSHPDLELRGYIKEADLQLNENTTISSPFSPRTIGHLNLIEGCHLVMEKNGQPLCEIIDFGGSMYFQSQDGARMAFDGQYIHKGQTSALHVGGTARYGTEGEASLDLQLKLESEGRDEATVRFSTRQLSTKFKFAEISLKNLGPSEFDILCALLTLNYPEYRDIHMTSGRIDATVLAYLKGLRLTDLKIEKIEGSNLEFLLIPWDAAFRVQNLSGELAINLATEKALETLNAELVIGNGSLFCVDGEYASCQFTDLQTRLSVKRGMVHKSVVSGEFAGLRGTIDLDSLSPDGEIVKLHFTGGTQGLATWMPDVICNAMQATLTRDELVLTAGMRKAPEGMEVEGTLLIKGGNASSDQLFTFGFDVEKSSRQLWGRWPAHRLAWEFWHSIGWETRKAAIPAIAYPTALLEAHWMRRQLGIAGFVVREGWFKTEHLPLNKYAAPILFPDNDIKLSGYGNFQGHFDHESMALNYQIEQLAMESSNFIFDMPQQSAKREGVHYFDFLTGSSYGSLAVANASYFTKEKGLLFNEIASDIHFAGQKVFFNDLTTVCTGLYFGGSLDLDFKNSEKGVFDTDIYIQTVRGKFSQLQQFFGHFDKLKFFQKIPLEGQLAVREPGIEMHMELRPGAFNIDTKVHGSLSQGSVQPNANLNAKEISCNFDFDQAAKTFSMTAIQGTIFSGKEDLVEEFKLGGEHIRFTDLERQEADFDLWIGDRQRDIFRLTGHTKTDPLDENGVEFAFDPHSTHFGDVHPEHLELNVKNWTQIKLFRLDLSLHLNTLFQDLLSLSRTGLFSLPDTIENELNTLKEVAGQFKLNFNYDDRSSVFGYRALGEEVTVNSHHFKKVLLQGSKKSDTWAIDQFALDEFSLATDLVKVSHGWKVNFLGLRLGESVLMGLEGEYRNGEMGFDGKVNLLEVNLSKLKEWPALLHFVEGFQPKGDIRATGQLHVEIDKSLPTGWRFDLLANASFKGCELKDIPFQDSVNVSVHLDSERGMIIRNLQTGFKSRETGQELGLLDFEKIEYLHDTSETIVNTLKFNIPSENIKKITTYLQAGFPGLFSPGVIAIVNDLKRHHNLEGTFSLTNAADAFAIQVDLKKGTYRFNEQEHQINNFILKYDLKELKILTQYKFCEHLFWLRVISQGPSFEKGWMILSDHHPEQQVNAKSPLLVEWTHHPQLGLQINKAVGYFAGLDVHLMTDPEIPLNTHNMHLVGSMRVKPQVAAALISSELQAQIRAWQMGDGYILNGKWRLEKDIAADESGKMHFHGFVEGNDITVKGYQFHKFQAHVDYTYGHLTMNQIRVDDPAGIMEVHQADIFKDPQGFWNVYIPHIVATNFRPSLLQEAGMPNVTMGKALLVRQLEIQNLSGRCADLSGMRGTGKMLFINPPKKNLQNTIFAIPAEILTMIGLDLTVLNPVSGTILFDIRDGKVYLSKFKDVYSEGKLSKFYLSHSEPSYLDFDGNLNVQIRMKQYNLFFKLAELFTVNIGGTILNPTYSLHKQRNQ